MALLTRDEILGAAVEVLDQGPEALTMRSLADRLGVTGAALYYWFPAKAVLLDAIAEYVAALIVATEHRGEPWEERIRSLALGIKEAAEQHPRTFNWVFTNYAMQPPLARIDEAMLDVLLSAGFDPRDAVLAKGAILRLVVGDLGLAPMPTHIDPILVDEEAYPRAHEVAAESAHVAQREFLEYGLDRFIAGLNPLRRPRQRAGARSRRL
ncbi:MAG: TetR/AcrR family transcriptional regulator [Acidimicrobiales bacterium]